jgi:hypothetical protein
MKKITAADLKRARKAANEKYGPFAKRFGVDRTTYYGWENYGIPKSGSAPQLIERVLAELSVQRAENVG